jgi:hypothetical protein
MIIHEFILMNLGTVVGLVLLSLKYYICLIVHLFYL